MTEHPIEAVRFFLRGLEMEYPRALTQGKLREWADCAHACITFLVDETSKPATGSGVRQEDETAQKPNGKDDVD